MLEVFNTSCAFKTQKWESGTGEESGSVDIELEEGLSLGLEFGPPIGCLPHHL